MVFILRRAMMTLAVVVLVAGAALAQDFELASYCGEAVEGSEVQAECYASDCTASCYGRGRLCDNTAFFFAGDGWKTTADYFLNNNFGCRFGFNTGIGPATFPIRGQIGLSLGGYDFFGRGLAKPKSAETQIFLTMGAYKRSNVCRGERLCYGVVWDIMNGHNFGVLASNITLHQIRGRVGYALNARNELGLWSAFRMGDDDLVLDDTFTTPIHAMNQVNFYWQHNWPVGADTMAYIGIADDPGDFVLGVRGHAPLSRRTALFGGVHYIVPSTSAANYKELLGSYMEETWNVSFGLVFYPGAKAISRTVSGHAGLPLLPVADNGTFAVEAPLAVP